MLSTHRLISCGSLVLLLMSSVGAEEPWQSLFDGKTLGKWKVVDDFDFHAHGKVAVRDGEHTGVLNGRALRRR